MGINLLETLRSWYTASLPNKKQCKKKKKKIRKTDRHVTFVRTTELVNHKSQPWSQEHCFYRKTNKQAKKKQTKKLQKYLFWTALDYSRFFLNFKIHLFWYSKEIRVITLTVVKPIFNSSLIWWGVCKNTATQINSMCSLPWPLVDRKWYFQNPLTWLKLFCL